MKAAELLQRNIPAKVVAKMLGITSRQVRKARQGRLESVAMIQNLTVTVPSDEAVIAENEWAQEQEKQKVRQQLREWEARLIVATNREKEVFEAVKKATPQELPKKLATYESHRILVRNTINVISSLRVHATKIGVKFVVMKEYKQLLNEHKQRAKACEKLQELVAA